MPKIIEIEKEKQKKSLMTKGYRSIDDFYQTQILINKILDFISDIDIGCSDYVRNMIYGSIEELKIHTVHWMAGDGIFTTDLDNIEYRVSKDGSVIPTAIVEYKKKKNGKSGFIKDNQFEVMSRLASSERNDIPFYLVRYTQNDVGIPSSFTIYKISPHFIDGTMFKEGSTKMIKKNIDINALLDFLNSL